MDPLPKKYLRAFLKLRDSLTTFAGVAVGTTADKFHASPSMRPFYFFAPTPSLPDRILTRPNIRDGSKGLKEMRVIFDQWLADDNLTMYIKLENVVDELERLVNSNNDAAQALSSTIEAHLYDIGIISQCIRQIVLYQPWAAGFEQKIMEPEMKALLDKDFPVFEFMEPYLGTCRQLVEGDLGELGNPSDGKFTYPVNRRRNEANTNAMRLAEKNLDTFYAGVDKVMGPYMTKRLRKLLARQELERTPPWTPPVKNSSTTIIETITQPMSEIHFQLEQSTERTIDRSQPELKSPKAKRRGAADLTRAAAAAAEPQDPEHESAPPQRTFEVDKRALKVFRALFHHPTPDSQPGEIFWADFLHAMTCAGFAAQKLYGSVWQFTPSLLDVDWSIHFHDPHGAKLPFRWARRFERRLFRTYGLHGAIFGLAGGE